MNDTPEFPAFAESEKVAARKRAVEAHLRSLSCCWPEWTPEVGGRCEVGLPVVHSVTHGAPRYHYMAPCFIREISSDRATFIVVVDYPPGAGNACDKRYNGEVLQLDITEIWAPVAILSAARKAARNHVTNA